MVAFDDVLADLGVAGVALRRAWPRSGEQLLLDLDDLERPGDRVAGQWHADIDIAQRVVNDTEGACRRGRVVLQPGGADRRLTKLAALLRRPDSRLVAHRPERRAVVELDGGARFAKLVPRRRLGGLRHAALRADRLPIRTPQVLPDEAERMLVTAALPGTPLSELLSGPRAVEALQAVGSALARLHRCPPPAGATVHGPQDEVAVTTRWEDWARTYQLPVRAPESGAPEADVAADAATVRSDSGGPPTPASSLRVIHRDLHDGQFLLTAGPDGRFQADGVGLLDFDLVAAGDPALDLANLIEHLWLRERQGLLSHAESAVRALLNGYGPDEDVLGRVIAYRALTARRLAALYCFRASNLAT
ncbi:MAG: phosphotransferase [Microlunatus sp.]